jgi:hypothetical protein
MEGICALCGKYGKLTFEHVPPEAAFNDSPIYTHTADHLVNKNSPVYGKRSRSNKGFGSCTLCAPCNNNTGGWYSKSYVDFARQGMQILTSNDHVGSVVGSYLIKPLNVIKQILTMFMSADKTGHLRSHINLVDYILDKESIVFPANFKVFIYSNDSHVKRMLGCSVVLDPMTGIQQWSEINFKPFGFLLAEDSGPAHPHMVDISNWGKVPYNITCMVVLSTILLEVTNMGIGVYSGQFMD